MPLSYFILLVSNWRFGRKSERRVLFGNGVKHWGHEGRLGVLESRVCRQREQRE